MERLEILRNRLNSLKEVRDFYVKSVKINGVLRPNPKSMQYSRVCMAIRKEIRVLENA